MGAWKGTDLVAEEPREGRVQLPRPARDARLARAARARGERQPPQKKSAAWSAGPLRASTRALRNAALRRSSAPFSRSSIGCIRL